MNNRTASRTTFGVLLFAWFNLAMLPCALAARAVVVPNDSPMVHGSALPSPLMQSQHVHGAATEAPPCHALQADCCELGHAVFGDSSPKFAKQPASAAGLPAAPAYAALRPPTLQRVWQPSAPPDPGSGAPRLHAIHCVYLD